MRTFTRLFMLAAMLLMRAFSLLAQPTVDPSGHWEGTINAPSMEVTIEIDLAKNAKGELAGTFGQAMENIKGLPLTTVTVEGRAIRMLLRPGAGGGTFNGTLAADGKSIAGDFVMAEGGHTIPFTLTRTGDARIAAAPKSPPIAKELEGTWNGALDLGGRHMRIVLKMANQADGTASGTLASPDGSGVDIPIAMAQKAAHFTIDVSSVGASFVGVLNAAGTELTGQWTQRGSSLPLTFTRAKP